MLAEFVVVLCYGLVAASSVRVGFVEARSRARHEVGWPVFWYLVSGVLLLIALAHLVDIAEPLRNAVRERAWADDWYDGRERVQIALGLAAATVLTVLVVAVAWFRRTYALVMVMVAALVLLAAVRLTSLHAVDSLLHDESIAGFRYGAVLELLGLTVLGGLIWHRGPNAHRVRHTGSSDQSVSGPLERVDGSLGTR